MDDSSRLRNLEAKLADLKARMPAHTPWPSMLIELEELEEEIEALRASSATVSEDAQGAA